MTQRARTGTGKDRVFTAELQKLGAFSASASRFAGAESGQEGCGFTPELAAMMMRAIEELRADVSQEIARLRGPAPETDGDDAAKAVAIERDRANEELDLLKNEVRSLALAIQRTKEEVVALYRSEDNEERMAAVTHELDTVVTATESATSEILESAEKIDAIAAQLRDGATDGFAKGLADEISEHVTKVYEASNFQDLTGQKLRKIVNTLLYVEERLVNIIEIWGEEDMEALPGQRAPTGMDGLDRTIEQHAETREQVSQADIDAMFD